MPITRALALAIRDWRRTAPPVSSYRSGNRAALTYELESHIDEIHSLTDTVIRGLLDTSPWDYHRLAASILEGVVAAREEVRNGLPSLAPTSSKPYEAFLDVAERTLRLIIAEISR